MSPIAATMPATDRWPMTFINLTAELSMRDLAPEQG
ncbi:hypothetical protein ABIF86_000188 [Bradyrhizobium japonicum]